MQAAGLLRIGEIVDVAPIGRRRLALRLLPQQHLDHAVPAGTARPEGVDIVPLAAHAQRELQRLDGPLLADQPRRLLELAAQIERQLRGIAAAIKQRRRQRPPELEPLLVPQRTEGALGSPGCSHLFHPRGRPLFTSPPTTRRSCDTAS